MLAPTTRPIPRQRPVEPPSLRDRVRSLAVARSSSCARRGFAWLPWLLCAVLALGAGYAGFVRSNDDKEYQDYLEAKKAETNSGEAAKNPTEQKNPIQVRRPRDRRHRARIEGLHHPDKFNPGQPQSRRHGHQTQHQGG